MTENPEFVSSFLADPRFAWLLAGGTLLAAARRQLSEIFAWIFSIAIVHTTHVDLGALCVQGYLQGVARRTYFGPRTYDAHFRGVRRLRRVMMVGCEILGSHGRLYWLGWVPIWLKGDGENRSANGTGIGTTSSNNMPRCTTLWFRGTLNSDRFVAAAAAYNNERAHSDNRRNRARHHVTVLTGMAGRSMHNRSHAGLEPNRPPNTTSPSLAHLAPNHRYVDWTEADFIPTDPDKDAMAMLALSPELQQLADDIQFWVESEQWYRDHDVPWQFGVCFYGLPGTGKTTFCRAAAERFDLPAIVLDLKTFTNIDLPSTWREQVLPQAPCMVVIEDVDRVFNGSKAVDEEHTELSFECLLNCISGLSRSDGVLVCITTNNLAMLDSALVDRKGRIDRVIEVKPLTEEGRWKLVKRICADTPNDWSSLVAAGDGMPAASFQYLCVEHATRALWAARRRAENDCVLPIAAASV